MKLGFEVWGRVRRPVGRVFKAVQAPKDLSAYFTTGGASGPLETGKTVMWDFADFPGKFPVKAKRVVKNQSILIAWGSATGGRNDVLFRFKKISPRSTDMVTRMIEERGVVVAEGSVRCARKDGGSLNAVFCDVFVMQDAKIRHLTSYLMEVKIALHHMEDPHDQG